MSEEFSRNAPFSREAEQSVLGAILIKPECINDILGIINKDDFFLRAHQEIYSALQGMFLKNREIDLVTLIDEVVKSGDASDKKHQNVLIGNAEEASRYIALISESVPTAANVVEYAKIVRDKSILRSLITECESIIEDAYSEKEDTQRLLEAAEKRIFSIAEKRENKSFVHIKDALMLSFNRLRDLETNRDEVLGMQTGFSGIDNVLVGMSKGDFVLVGARPGMGKTAFTMNLAVNAAMRTKKAVCIFSLEMSTEQLTTRLLSSEALVDSHKLRSGTLDEEDWEKLGHASARLAGCNILIDDTPGVTVTAMKAKLRRTENLGLVIIDYLGLMQSERRIDNKVQEIAEISRNLKLMAKELGIPVVTCAQLSRASEKRTDNRPVLSDLRDSGAIEQDADVVMFIYRPGEYDKNDPEKKTKAEIIIAKNRHGSQGTVEMGWLGQYTKFTTRKEDGIEEQ